MIARLERTMANSYRQLATVYDQMMSDYDYEYSLSLIASYAVGRGLDVGCGSGKFTIALAGKRMDMTGLDRSSDKLRVARDSSRQAGKRITYIEGDILDTPLGRDRYDLVTAMCDVFNYVVADEQLLEVFLSIYTSIKSGGTLIFDVSSRAKLTDLVEQGQYVYDAEDVTYIWTNTISQDLVDMDITFFVKEGESYTRFDEYHTQRIYDKQHLLDMLKSCGYVDVECIDRGDRYYFIAKVRK